MFSKDITQSDAFLDMPIGSQVLYFHFSMEADDDGFVSSPKRLMKLIGTQEDEYKILLAKRFVISFKNGICVIKHWKINNQIRADRYKPTKYTKEMDLLLLKENGAYTEAENVAIMQETTIGIPSGNQTATIGKPSIGKVSIGKASKVKKRGDTPSEIARDLFNPDTQLKERVISYLVKKDIPEDVSRSELDNFIGYWTELNKSGTKQRWELENF